MHLFQQQSTCQGTELMMVIPSSPEYLKIVRAVVRELGELDGWSKTDVQAVTLALDEACSNIIRHAYGGAKDQPIQIIMASGVEEVRIELLDQGDPVDPERVKPRDLDQIRPGGLGVHLIRSLMDEVTFDTQHGGRNRLILTRRITRKHERET